MKISIDTDPFEITPFKLQGLILFSSQAPAVNRRERATRALVAQRGEPAPARLASGIPCNTRYG